MSLLVDTLTNDTVHQVTGGTAVATTTLITSTDLNTVKAVIISAVLSGVAQIIISIFKKLASKINGNQKSIEQKS
jgi:hypothetical protein